MFYKKFNVNTLKILISIIIYNFNLKYNFYCHQIKLKNQESEIFQKNFLIKIINFFGFPT